MKLRDEAKERVEQLRMKRNFLGNFGRKKKSACSRAQNAALLRGNICKKNIGRKFEHSERKTNPNSLGL